MADFWVDSAVTAGQDGTTPAKAWKYLKAALESVGGFAAGDRIWVRRTLAENATATVSTRNTGRANAPIQVIGWPRASVSGTGNFTNGSTTVSSVSFTLSLRRFGARWLICPEGQRYMVTYIQSSSALNIDRPYAGATQNGATFSIAEDDEYADRPSAGSGWDSDSQDLPQIRGGTTSTPVIEFGGDRGFWWIKNMNIYKMSNGGIITHSASQNLHNGCISYKGCVISWVSNHNGSGAGLHLTQNMDAIHLERCAIGGIAGVSNTCVGIYAAKHRQRISLRDVVIESSNTGIYLLEPAPISLENVNIGVEAANNYANIKTFGYNQFIVGRNVWLGQATEAYKIRLDADTTPQLMLVGPFVNINIEGWEKKLDQIYRDTGQLITSKAVATESTDPLKRSNGSDVVLIANLGTGGQYWGPHPEQVPEPVFDQRIWAEASIAKTYRVYMQSTVAIASGKVWLEAEYIEKKSSNSAWAERRKLATASIAQRSGSNDWSQYVEVTGIAPHVDSTVRLKLYASHYASGASLYVDPKAVPIEE